MTGRAGNGPPGSPATEQLCRACGMCCDGTLFARALLAEGEPATLGKRALPLVEHEGKQALPQPCPAHQGSACGIYFERPRACVSYRCKLLQSLSLGGIDLDGAIAKVQRARALARAIGARLEVEARGRALYRSAELLFEGEGGAEWRRSQADLLLDMATFLRLARRDFGAGEVESLGGKNG